MPWRRWKRHCAYSVIVTWSANERTVFVLSFFLSFFLAVFLLFVRVTQFATDVPPPVVAKSQTCRCGSRPSLQFFAALFDNHQCPLHYRSRTSRSILFPLNFKHRGGPGRFAAVSKSRKLARSCSEKRKQFLLQQQGEREREKVKVVVSETRCDAMRCDAMR